MLDTSLLPLYFTKVCNLYFPHSLPSWGQQTCWGGDGREARSITGTCRNGAGRDRKHGFTLTAIQLNPTAWNHIRERLPTLLWQKEPHFILYRSTVFVIKWIFTVHCKNIGATFSWCCILLYYLYSFHLYSFQMKSDTIYILWHQAALFVDAHNSSQHQMWKKERKKCLFLLFSTKQFTRSCVLAGTENSPQVTPNGMNNVQGNAVSAADEQGGIRGDQQSHFL